MTTLEKISAVNKTGKFICVGLDPDIEKIPYHLKSLKNPLLDFNKSIIDSTVDLTAAYKINFAFYERDGNRGLENLQATLDHIPSNLITIADAKRGDIGNSSLMYAKSIFGCYNFDAVTLNPLMGYDSIEPFINYTDKLNFMLTLTSNKGSMDFEKLLLDNGRFLYQEIIEKVRKWDKTGNCGIVFGATNRKELFENTNQFGSLPVLLPGVGAQGGKLEDVVKAFSSAGRKNYLINVSRGIIYKSGGEDFAVAARDELTKLNNEIKKLINNN